MAVFDEVILRDAGCRKYGQLQQMFGTEDVLPLWIADMDFRTPTSILNILREVVDQPIQGYNLDYPLWKEAVITWYRERYHVEIDKAWLHFVPGVIKTIVFSLMALSKPGETVLTCSPIYDPYPNLVETSGRKLLQTCLIEKSGGFEFDWNDFEEKLNVSRIFLFSSPHNPGGVVWSKETLNKISQLCHKAGVLIISDEVHSDLTLPGYCHTPFLALDEDPAPRSIVLTSISKAFNTPAIQGGIAIIKNPALRREFYGFLDNCYLAETNTIQQAAIYSAYTSCRDWHQQLLSYLADNVALVRNTLERDCPLISVVHGGASYLLFLNAEKMGLTDEQLQHFWVYEARLGLSPGLQYGKGGEQHARLNVACSRTVLTEAMERLKAAYSRYRVIEAADK